MEPRDRVTCFVFLTGREGRREGKYSALDTADEEPQEGDSDRVRP